VGELYQQTTSSSICSREDNERDPLETDLPKLMLDLQGAQSSRTEMERGEDILSKALYHDQEHHHSEQLSEAELKLFEGDRGDERDRDDDESHKRGQHDRGDM
jgi:hypothetical protein